MLMVPGYRVTIGDFYLLKKELKVFFSPVTIHTPSTALQTSFNQLSVTSTDDGPHSFQITAP
jgi:hypothetical protein